MAKFDYKSATVAEIDKAVQSIGKRGAALQDDIQAVALACIVQIQDHGNVVPLNRLYNAIPEGSRKVGFALWAQRFAGIKANKDKDTKASLPLAYHHDTDLSGAIKNPWYTVRSEPNVQKALDAQEAVKALVKKLIKAEGVKHPEYVERLRAAFPDEFILVTETKKPKKGAKAKKLPAGIVLPANLPAQVQ
jgi:hypothetical protein